jgi:hypothetical protein
LAVTCFIDPARAYFDAPIRVSPDQGWSNAGLFQAFRNQAAQRGGNFDKICFRARA